MKKDSGTAETGAERQSPKRHFAAPGEPRIARAPSPLTPLGASRPLVDLGRLETVRQPHGELRIYHNIIYICTIRYILTVRTTEPDIVAATGQAGRKLR